VNGERRGGRDPEARESGTAADPDETVVVARAQGEDPDATVAVARAPGPAADPEATIADPDATIADPDATIAVPDATIAVAREREPEEGSADATIAVPRERNADSDATIAVPRERKADPDATVAVVRPRPPAGSPTRGTPAPPIPEPDHGGSSGELADRFFKPPLDARRRAPESPFPHSGRSEPRFGVRPGRPVVYGARSDAFLAPDDGAVTARIGDPPAPAEPVPAAARDALPSLARQNRRFRVLALAGGAAVLAIVGFGLWGVASLAFG